MQTDFEQAERISQRRPAFLSLMALLFLAQQSVFFTFDGRAVSAVKMGAWTVLALVLLAYLLTGGHWLRSKRVRELANDELSTMNRMRGVMAGFGAAIFTAILVFVVAPFEPIEAPLAGHLVASVGIGGALIRFALLERKGDG
ncbi:hypothetical protein [Qipengyuania oceanensis]|uniref:Uncharacterized protein n=1 Tax=Qipengyuania oceanensis TaxID=1463597 RepID=A0A844YIQ8_9SPHN|nr:hypothetical protein [Qipengyuania oceanensis]MXO63395.1 hypothetical protein [Qipengyuania oceanensis]